MADHDGSDGLLQSVVVHLLGFFDRFLPRGTLLDRIEKAHEAAENTFTDALNTLEGRKSFKLDPASVAVTGSEITHFLYHCYRLRGGNIECCSSDMARLVEAGLAIVHRYEPGAKGKSVGVVAEPLVRNFLERTNPTRMLGATSTSPATSGGPLAPATAISPS